jgi:integrase
VSPKKRRSRIWWREDRGVFYGDFRGIGDGKKESLRTKDHDVAVTRAAARMKELRAKRAERVRIAGDPLIEEYVKHHLDLKRKFRRGSTVDRDELSLRQIQQFRPFGRGARLSDVTTERLTRYLVWRREHTKTRRGGPPAPQTVAHELNALSSMFKRAVSEGHAAMNPVSQLVDRPRIQREEVEWLEPEEAARFLAECTSDLHTLMAIALLSGTRRSEATGLEWEDVDFERGLIRLRPNRWRKLKRPHCARSIRLWPQLRETLEPLQQGSGLVVPNRNGKPYTDLRRGMEAAAERAKITKPISWNTLRHTYASLRLQCVENGAAISPFKVAKELGHKGLTMIFEHYGHILESPQRLELVEYRVAPDDGMRS